MSKNLYLNIDDDITRAMRKIQREPADDITLVLPKGSLLFSDVINLKLMKAQTDQLGKTVSILTMDPKGQQRASEAGFGLKDFSALKREGPSVDMIARPKASGPRPVARPARPQAPAMRTPPPTSPAVPARLSPVMRTVPKKTVAELFSNQAATEPIQDRKQVNPNNAEAVRNIPPSIAVPKKKSFWRRFFRKTMLTVVIVVLLIIAVSVGFLLPQATITIQASTVPIQRDLDLALDTSFTQASAQQLTLPAKIVSGPQQQSKQFQATGALDLGNKSHGTIQIYNFTKNILKLKASTTILTYKNLVFHLTQDASGLKPTKLGSDGKNPDLASLSPTVDVVADQGGEAYNLPLGTRLEITNQVLGSNPSQIYATATVPFSGGASRLSATITQKDIDGAKQQLSDILLEAANQQLMNTQHLTIIPSGAKVDVTETAFDKKVGDQSLTFYGSVTGSIKALAYDPDQLKNLIEQRVKITLDDDKILETGQKEVITAKFKSLDLDNGKGVLSIHFESAVGPRLDQETLAGQLKSKNAQEIKDFLMAKDGVSDVKVRFFPFWTKTAPKIPGRVKIVIQTP